LTSLYGLENGLITQKQDVVYYFFKYEQDFLKKTVHLLFK